MSPTRLSPLLLALLLAAAGPAAGQAGSYEASANVADQSPGARDPALREALSQVIERVSGAGALAQAQGVLARAPQLVQRYGYERDETRQLRLTAAFDPKAVDNALKGLGLPVWGVFAGPVEDVGVAVGGIRNAPDYARVLNALRALPGVKAVRVESASGDRVTLTVRAEGGGARLAGAASIGGQLIRDDTGSGLSFSLAP